LYATTADTAKRITDALIWNIAIVY
jgi:hypothetical protein